MAGEVKLNPQHGSMADRIAKRGRNSGEGSGADHTVQTGHSPQRVFTNIHSTGGVKAHGSPKGDMGDQ